MRSDTLNSSNDMAEDIDIEELLEAPYVKEMKKNDVSKNPSSIKSARSIGNYLCGMFNSAEIFV